MNAGIVGMPHGTTGAQWALLAIQLRRTKFDREALATFTWQAKSSAN